MRLAQVLVGDTLLVGQLEAGLPPDDDEGDVVLRDAARVLHTSLPVQSELGGVGVMHVPSLALLPLDAACVIPFDAIGFWAIQDVDPAQPTSKRVEQYLELIRPLGAPAPTDGGGGKRTRLTS